MQSKSFVDETFDGSFLAFIAAFTKKQTLSDNEIADTPSNESVSTSEPSVTPETHYNTVPESTTAVIITDYNHSFEAKVLEVNENTILVEPLEGENERNSASKIYISTNLISANSVPEMKTGDTVRIVYNGLIQETYPASISDVFSINLVN